MAITAFLCSPITLFCTPASSRYCISAALPTRQVRTRECVVSAIIRKPKNMVALVGAGLTLTLVGSASAAELPLLGSSLQLGEPVNALSLPTWAVHVSSVVEWITAMALVWQYGEKSGYESWKGLSWGMVPLLGGALCACTWHFFYNSEALEVLVALQAALTVIGNATMCIAAFRIYKSVQEHSKNL
ncbi:Ycf49-like protein [Quillaja saponaria]|uniref:Ycf49-like protein n=1 Tax=Quillaja saponaria TaxID=32244 RepID=A0AAD7KSH4_QUISA|nr:Ycf49-like protein [Quillaja saponaria]